MGHAIPLCVRVGIFPRSETGRRGACADDGGARMKYAFRTPDLGEGTTQAEIVAWRVKVGDLVREDQPIADLMTDKATVEVYSPVSGTIVALRGAPGETMAVGSELVVFDVAESA